VRQLVVVEEGAVDCPVLRDVRRTDVLGSCSFESGIMPLVSWSVRRSRVTARETATQESRTRLPLLFSYSAGSYLLLLDSPNPGSLCTRSSE
jgi:hypothetical protein